MKVADQTATVYDIESNTILYRIPGNEADRDLAMHRRNGATVTHYTTTDRTGRPIHVALTVDAPRHGLTPDQGAVYLFTDPAHAPTTPHAPSTSEAQQYPDPTDEEASAPSDGPYEMNGQYRHALAVYEAKGAAHAPDDALMAGFCEYDVPHLVGAVAPQLVWEGAQKQGLTTRQLATLCQHDVMAVDDLQCL